MGGGVCGRINDYGLDPGFFGETARFSQDLAGKNLEHKELSSESSSILSLTTKMLSDTMRIS